MTHPENNPDRSDDRLHLSLPESAKFWHHYQRYPYLLAKVALWGAVVYAIIWALQNVQSVLFPLFLSLLIAYCLDPLVDWFEERGWSRTLAIALLIVVAGVGVTVFVLILEPALEQQIKQLGSRLPELVTTIQTKVIPWAVEKGIPVPDTLSAAMQEYGAQIQAQIPALTQKVGGWVAAVLNQTGTLVASLLNIVMVPVFTFYFLRDFDRMKDPLVDFIPDHRREFVLKRIRKMDEVVGAWFRGQVEVALILAVLYSIGLGIIFHFSGLGVMVGIAVGVLTGLLNIIPYFGFLIGVILSSTLVILNWSGPGPAIGLIAVFTGVQLLEGYLITPKVVGDKVGLSPVTVIIVLLLGGELLGLLGVLLAIPVAGIIRALLPDFIAYYRTTAFFTNEFRGPEEDDDWMVSIAQIRSLLAKTDQDNDVRMEVQESEDGKIRIELEPASQVKENVEEEGVKTDGEE